MTRELAALVDPIERAIAEDRVTSLAAALVRLDAAGAFAMPDLFAPPRQDHYARRLIWRDPSARFVVIGMTWAPGQSSPLHDHAGLWGAEIVVAGTMEETAFRLLDRDADGRYRFAREQRRSVEKGTLGILIPPLEYHDFANAGTTTARTLHVYSGELARCQAFAAEEDGWWRARCVELAYDA